MNDKGPNARPLQINPSPLLQSLAIHPCPYKDDKGNGNGMNRPTEIPGHGNPGNGQGQSTPGNGNHGPDPTHTTEP